MGCDRSVASGWRVRSQETSVEAAKDLTVAGVRAAQPSGGIDSRSTVSSNNATRKTRPTGADTPPSRTFLL